MREQQDRRSKKRAKHPLQASLFDPTSDRPRWESLPPDVRRAATEILTRMMREAAEQRREVAPTASARSEKEDAND